MFHCDLCLEPANYHLCDEHAAEGEHKLLGLSRQLAEANRQRDELLAALGDIAKVIHWGGRYHLVVDGFIVATEGDICRDGINPELSGVKHWNKETFDKVTAAIAHARGGSGGAEGRSSNEHQGYFNTRTDK